MRQLIRTFFSESWRLPWSTAFANASRSAISTSHSSPGTQLHSWIMLISQSTAPEIALISLRIVIDKAAFGPSERGSLDKEVTLKCKFISLDPTPLQHTQIRARYRSYNSDYESRLTTASIFRNPCGTH